MQAPDALDRVQYMPPDKIIHLHQADPDRRQKFSRTLEEEEDEAEKKRKKHPHDDVELKSEDTLEHEQPKQSDEKNEASADSTMDNNVNTDLDKHIDLKA